MNRNKKRLLKKKKQRLTAIAEVVDEHDLVEVSRRGPVDDRVDGTENGRGRLVAVHDDHASIGHLLRVLELCTAGANMQRAT